MNPDMLEVPQAPLEDLLETGTALLVSRMLKGSLDEKEQAFRDALQRMIADAAVAKFHNRLPELPRAAGQEKARAAS